MMDVVTSKDHNSLPPRKGRYILGAIFALVVAVMAQVFVIKPLVQTYVLDTVVESLASKGFRLSPGRERPKVTWAMYPPAVGVEEVYLELYNNTDELHYFTAVYFDRLEYRLDRTRTMLWSRALPKVKPPGESVEVPLANQLVEFATISWHNCTITLHELHPQPRITLENGTIRLSALPLRGQLQRLKDEVSSKLWQGGPPLTPEPPSRLLDIAVRSVQITTHTVTSIPLSVTHPTVTRLITTFPTFFGMFTKPAGIVTEGQPIEHPIIYPPHLSLFAPSLIFPAIFQGISSLRRTTETDDASVRNKISTYEIPTPFSNLVLQINLVRKGVKRMQPLSLSLVHIRENVERCSSLLLARIESVELSGREKGGSGGCCTLQVLNSSNKPSPFEPVEDVVFTDINHSMWSLAINYLSAQYKRTLALALHPFYIAAYAFSLRDLFTRIGDPDLCGIQEVVQYHIADLEWVDKTPTTSSTIVRALAQVHSGFLNLFEDAVSLVT